MKRSKAMNITIVLLLVASFNLLMLGTICYALEDNIEHFKYSDTSEYQSITAYSRCKCCCVSCSYYHFQKYGQEKRRLQALCRYRALQGTAQGI